ncbi:hypothetical protein AB4Y45_43785 [Paraburkholderia sp. EG287A]|uniref:hypothetical protein n=1 Tax=unclassified Paraburkholderia TaxID=2615204 RepID=UPI0034D257C4
MARSNFSGAMLGRPPFMSASYIWANSRSIFASASFAITRIERNGCDFGTKSSSLRMENKLSVNVSAPRMISEGKWLSIYQRFTNSAR